jgi:hypothetical protein
MGFLFFLFNVLANILFTALSIFLAPIFPMARLLSIANCASGLPYLSLNGVTTLHHFAESLQCLSGSGSRELAMRSACDAGMLRGQFRVSAAFRHEIMGNVSAAAPPADESVRSRVGNVGERKQGREQ